MSYLPRFMTMDNFKDTFPRREAFLYGNITLSLAQAQQQPSLGLPMSLTSMISGNTRPKASVHFNVQNWPMPGSCSGVLSKKPH